MPSTLRTNVSTPISFNSLNVTTPCAFNSPNERLYSDLRTSLLRAPSTLRTPFSKRLQLSERHYPKRHYSERLQLSERHYPERHYSERLQLSERHYPKRHYSERLQLSERHYPEHLLTPQWLLKGGLSWRVQVSCISVGSNLRCVQKPVAVNSCRVIFNRSQSLCRSF